MATAAKEGADFYDGWWEAQWGDHIHQGYYGPGDPANASVHRDAQVRMIEEALKFADVSADDRLKMPKNILDVGCGLGASSRYFATKYGANCCGINLSSCQVQRAKELATADGLGDRVSFVVGDALDQPFPDGQFDLVWAMEIADHIPNKIKFVSELARIAAPGATIIITAVCHRELSPGEETLQPDEKNLLGKICNALHLSLSCAASGYVKIAESLSLQEIKVADWSEYVVPSCRVFNRSTWTWRGLSSSLLDGWSGIKRALALPWILKAYDRKLIKYTVIACRKPEYGCI